ncbi:TIGR03085 family protein [Pseudonocardiaceae bacterium YIM PH 21723]|nr:TIGR03085 family protein [Pseudonocardiaceae bacterium YIM PH 21723]
MGIAATERAELSDLLEQLGPQAPTLCAGWQTRQLAAHLVLREHRIDAQPGIVLSALAGYTAKVQDEIAAWPWQRLVDTVRGGPPWWSPFRLAPDALNGAEYLVHHEDVRRGGEDWEPRPADATRDKLALGTLRRMGRTLLRGKASGLRLCTPDGHIALEIPGPGVLTITGEPVELLLFAFGRDATRLHFDGDIDAIRGLRRGL